MYLGLKPTSVCYISHLVNVNVNIVNIDFGRACQDIHISLSTSSSIPEVTISIGLSFFNSFIVAKKSISHDGSPSENQLSNGGNILQKIQ